MPEQSEREMDSTKTTSPDELLAERLSKHEELLRKLADQEHQDQPEDD